MKFKHLFLYYFNYMLTKKGYVIQKTDNNQKLINELKKELHVKPHQTFSIGNKDNEVEGFNVYIEDENSICIPKFYAIKKFGKPEKDDTPLGQTVDINFKGEMRQKQLDIMKIVFNNLDANDGGLLCLGCGSGKTVMALYTACQLKVKTLVVVHKSFLLNQWKERAAEFTDAKIGIIQQDKVDIEGKQIVIGMLQSISKDKYSSDIFKDFGLVIFDEAHHAPSQYFSKALPIIACKKTLALSATPNRADKLEKILFWYFGDIMYKAPAEAINNLVVKSYKYNCDDKNFREYKMYTGDVNRPKTLTKITEIEERNKFILILIKEILEEEGRKLIILSDRLEHLNVIKDSLDLLEIATTSYYIGGMKEKKLNEASKAQVIFSTYSMSAEGLDIPELNTLLLLTPRKEVEQIVGRITRKKDHPVVPTVIDIVDQLPSFSRQFNSRKKFYESKDFIIKLYDVEGHKIIKEYDYEKVKKTKKVYTTTCVGKDEVDFID